MLYISSLDDLGKTLMMFKRNPLFSGYAFEGTFVTGLRFDKMRLRSSVTESFPPIGTEINTGYIVGMAGEATNNLTTIDIP